ncbi:MAG TPA: tryptophan 2,3-dioxygenase family protein [Candidatus Thermoplasmatota archaeon]|nr:tryptophan 2,3-dioxygenase family protein [Candidatus Thermoplasmatota archaeon]
MTATDAPKLSGQGATDYERYLKVPELLSLQKPAESLAHHDELLFQVEHQTAELWFKLVIFEMDEAIRHMSEDRPLEAATLLERATRAIRVTAEQVLILSTMAPRDYHTIRLALGRGSGAESPGFRGILTNAPKLWAPFKDLLGKRGVTLFDVYRDHRSHYDVFLLAEALTNFDMYFQLWRQNHVTFIKRVIGRDVRSLQGYSVHDLEKVVQMQLFPDLWTVRNELTTFTGTSRPL